MIVGCLTFDSQHDAFQEKIRIVAHASNVLTFCFFQNSFNDQQFLKFIDNKVLVKKESRGCICTILDVNYILSIDLDYQK